MVKEYEAIAVGSGSATIVLGAMMEQNQGKKFAIVDKDVPGGICLTRGCIPSKLLLYPADVVAMIQEANELGIQAEIQKVDFPKIMGRMRGIIDADINEIRKGFSSTPGLDYYPTTAEFVSPYTLKAGSETITSKKILLGIGSRAVIPKVEGLEHAGYLTSDSLLHLKKLPESVVIIGGGYIAAEYGHFLSAMGSKVAIVGRNPQFIPEEEPEVSWAAKAAMSKRMAIATNHEVVRVEKPLMGKKVAVARDRASGKEAKFACEEILVASGRESNADLLHCEKAGIATDAKGWIKVNDKLETSQPGIYAFGDATGKWLFRHKANHEARVVLSNVVYGKEAHADYRAVPHAVFTHPEIASFGLREAEAVQKFGANNLSIGFQKYEDTGKGMAMNVHGAFAKVIIENKTGKILGAHIVGPQASVLIQELINAMHSGSGTIEPVQKAMHIHPSLTEVV